MTQAVGISLVALVLSVLSLCWQFISWRRSGPVVKTKTGSAFNVGGPPDFHLITVTATNRGRAATEVQYMTLELPGGKTFPPMPNLMHGTAMPRKLEPGGETAVSYEYDYVQQALRQVGASRFRPRVTTGHKVVRGKWERLG